MRKQRLSGNRHAGYGSQHGGKGAAGRTPPAATTEGDVRAGVFRQSAMQTPVLVLNASYEPINICGARRALVLVLKGVARTEEEQGAILHAARMRVDRAVDKLRGRLALRGITSTVAALGTALAQQVVGTAPASLGAQVVGQALAGAGAAGVGAAGFSLAAKLSLAALAVGEFFVHDSLAGSSVERPFLHPLPW